MAARAVGGLIVHRLLLRLRRQGRLLDLAPRPEAHGGLLERDAGDDVVVAGDPEEQPRLVGAGEVEARQLAAGLDAEGVGHSHAAAAGGAVGHQPDHLAIIFMAATSSC